MIGYSTIRTYRKWLHSLLTAVLVILSSLQTPAVWADTPATALVGQLSGQLSVENGAASYTLPIKLPPGVAGMQPELSINYSSNSGNGLLGIGFSLGGLSTISRCPATYAQDGFKGSVYFDQRDRYCLDGQRLIAISGSDGGDGTEYRTEIDGHSRIISNGQQGSGPRSWTVHTKSGQTLEYGNTDDSRVEKPGDTGVRSWAVDSISDTVGNSLTVSYHEDNTNGEHYPLRVDYGDNSVRFEYEARSDTFIGYQGGGKISLSQRLSRITIHSGEPQAMEYVLRYREGRRSMLAGITQMDANGDALPELVFDWGQEDGTELKGVEPLTKWEYTVASNNQYLPEWSSGGESQGNTYSQYLDMNGDGLPDRVNHYNYSTNESGIWVALNNGSGFGPLTRWEYTATHDNQYLPQWGNSDGGIYSQYLDINGDGLPDRVNHCNYSTGEYGIWVALNNGSGFDPLTRWEYTATHNSQYLPEWGSDGSINSQFLDINGDGLPDRVNHYNYSTGEYGIWVALNNGSGFEPLTKWQYTATSNDQYLPQWGSSSGNVLSQYLDMNGDGLPDRVNSINYSNMESGIWVALNNGSGFGPLTKWAFTPALSGIYPIRQYNPIWSSDGNIYSQYLDMNGDGLPDRVNHFNYTHTTGELGIFSDGEPGIWVALNNGRGFEPLTKWEYTASNIKQYLPQWISSGSVYTQYLDINGDGLPDRINHIKYGNYFRDIVTIETTETTGVCSTSNLSCGDYGIWIALNNGNGFEPLARWEFTSPQKAQYRPRWGEGNETYIKTYSQYLDINGDGLPDRVNHHNYSTGESGIWAAHSKQKQPRIVGITPLDGNETRIEYKYLTDSTVYTKGTGAVYPEIDIGGPMAVVSRVESSNGIGGMSGASYRYGGAKIHVLGRGLLGFAWIESTDEQTGITSRTEYRQDFPYSGMVSRSEQRLSDNTLIGESSSQYSHTTAHNGSVYALEVTQSVEQSYELDGTLVSTVTTDNANIDDYGNVGTITVTTQAGGESYSKVNHNSYSNDQQNWLLGRLTHATVTHYHNNGTQESRNSSFTYDADTGLLLTETIEPGSSDAITTTYQYDQFGNKISATISADGLDPRTTTTTYDAQGRFPISSSNALGHSETKVYDPVCGQPAFLTGPNGLTTSWEYDTLCRKTRESRADGTETTWSYAWDDGSGPQYALYQITETSSGKPPASVWYDALGRELRKQHTGFDGTLVYQDTDYNSLGQVERKSLPYFSGDTSYWVESDYDIIGRVITTRRPAPGGGMATATTDYQGLTTVTTNALGQNKTSLKNALGKMARVDEEEGGWVEYTYDAVGNLTQTNAAGVITTMEYDLRGRKISMDDHDMGHWTYDYNAYGELVSQTDAKNQTVTMEYDDLGRMVTRIESEGTTTWSYDTAANGIGKVAQVQAPLGYLKSYSYDTLGRPSTTTTNADNQSFSTTATYDAYSRVSMVTRPQGFQLENLYNQHGYLSAIRAPSSQIEDYDWDHIAAVLQQALDTAQQYTDMANAELAQAAVYQAQADQYNLLADQYSQDLADQLRAAADQLEASAAELQALAAEHQAAAQPYLDQVAYYTNLASTASTVGYILYMNQAASYQALAQDELDQADTLLAQADAALAEAAQNDLDADAQEETALANEQAVADYVAQAQAALAQAEIFVAQAESYNAQATELQEDIAHYQEMVNDSDHIYFWRAKSRDAAGRLSSHIVGNGLVTDRGYNPATGQLQHINSSFGYAAPIRHLEYQYDPLDNVTSRHDHIQGLSETFEYDRLNRLTNSHVSGQIGEIDYNYSVDYTYDALGNMLHKSDIGDYTYGDTARTTGNAGPHAILSAGLNHNNYQYDLNGSLIEGGGRTIEWTSFNKPKRFAKDGQETNFVYGPDRARYLKVTDTSRTLYIDKSYEQITEGESTKHKHFIYADGQLVAIHIKSEQSGETQPDETRYLHRDSLGSIDTITDGRGNIVERMSYQPFGKRRAGNWRSDIDIIIPALTNRGFTGHEHIDEMGLIHMNGRVYDPELGRFLSADPHVQNPYASQSYNRYSYVQNNPLKYTDPSGYFLKKLFKSIGKAIKSVFRAVKKYWQTIVQVVAMATGQVWMIAAVNASLTLANGGSWGDALASAAITVATIQAFRVAGAKFPGRIENAVAHGVIGGVRSAAMGGKFGPGFLSGAFGSVATPGSNDGFDFGNFMLATAAGGVGAVLGGGKFKDGSVTAAFGYVFNAAAHSRKNSEGHGHGMSRADFEKKYGDILKAGGIDIDANIKEAKAMSYSEWIDAVHTGGKWDYKNDKVLISADFSAARLDEFGNVHFGIVAAAQGFDLATSLFGAGTYQVFRQSGGSLWDWANAPFMATNDQARIYTKAGGTWGDNPGDSLNIMRGWDYYDSNY